MGRRVMNLALVILRVVAESMVFVKLTRIGVPKKNFILAMYCVSLVRRVRELTTNLLKSLFGQADIKINTGQVRPNTYPSTSHNVPLYR